MTINAYSPLWLQLFMPLQAEEVTRKDADFLARQLPLPRYRRGWTYAAAMADTPCCLPNAVIR